MNAISSLRATLSMNRRLAFAGLALALAACGGGSGGSASPPSQPALAYLSAPDCAGPANHIGDPGTAELAGEIANRVTWAVGDLTGFYPPDPATSGAQRGF